MPRVNLPSSLRGYVGQQTHVHVEGETVSTVLTRLASIAPGLRSHLFAADQLRPFVVISKNGKDVRLLSGLQTEVSEADEIRILSSIAGG
jgi:molybdopterin synthase sulfur carrier subunit